MRQWLGWAGWGTNERDRALARWPVERPRRCHCAALVGIASCTPFLTPLTLVLRFCLPPPPSQCALFHLAYHRGHTGIHLYTGTLDCFGDLEIRPKTGPGGAPAVPVATPFRFSGTALLASPQITPVAVHGRDALSTTYCVYCTGLLPALCLWNPCTSQSIHSDTLPMNINSELDDSPQSVLC